MDTEQTPNNLPEGKLGLNKAGNTRGMHVRKPETIAKQKVKTVDRAIAQYVRSADSRVGKYLRINETRKYNKTLEKADNVAAERSTK